MLFGSYKLKNIKININNKIPLKWPDLKSNLRFQDLPLILPLASKFLKIFPKLQYMDCKLMSMHD